MSRLRVGDLLEQRYRVDTPIARGGMSTVYRCVDLRLGRSVAAKVMDEKFMADPAFRSRFRREARAMAQLSHPNLVGVYDTGADGEHLFLIMELITGGTLRELLAERGPMPPHAAMAVMDNVLKGLKEVHRAGMVHRDIKPDNVLIGSDHAVKVSDFGLVRAAAAETAAQPGSPIIGTAAYLSPEQVRGEAIGPASDVYSAGIVLFELLTGLTPFSGDDSYQIARARLKEPVPAPGEWIDGVPEELNELVAVATAADPEDRYANASEFHRAVAAASSRLQLPAFRVPVPTNAAAHRAAQHPTDLKSTDLITSVMPNQAEQGEPAAAAAPGGGQRPPETQETKVVSPVVPAAPLPPGAPGTPMPTRTFQGQAPQQPYQPAYAPASVPAARQPAGPVAQSITQQPKKVSNRSPLGTVIWWGVLAVLIIFIALMAWWFGSGRYGEVPQVVGMQQAAATEKLEQAGYDAQITERYSDTDAAAGVIATKPAAGQRFPHHKAVELMVSKGRPTVPDFGVGQSPESFRDALAQRTLVYADGGGEYSDDAPEGSIARTDPPSDTPMGVGATVTVFSSKGPAPIAVPSVEGVEQDQAVKLLEREGLKVAEVRKDFDGKTPGGKAITTDPAPETPLRRGDTITLVVSNAITMPTVTNMSEEDARKAVEKAKLKVATVTTDTVSARKPDTVVSSFPEAGTLVDPQFPQVDLKTNGKVLVPSLFGRSVADAKETVKDAGLGLSFKGKESARIVSQKPRAGEEADVGSIVRVTTF